MSFRQHGTFHSAVQDPDLEGLLAKNVAAGASSGSRYWITFPKRNPAGWSTPKNPLALYSSFIAIATSGPIQLVPTAEHAIPQCRPQHVAECGTTKKPDQTVSLF